MRLSRYKFLDFELDPASRELSRHGERIALPPKSFECLAYLVAHRDRAVGRDELIAAVWGRVEVSDTVVAQTLLRARKALGDAGDRQEIVRTVPRFGYRWVAPVEEVDPSVPAAVQAPAAAEPAPEVVQTFDAPPARRSRMPWFVALSLLVVVVVVGGWWWMKREAPVQPVASHAPVGDVVLVLPVAVAPVESESAWVRLGAMDYVASRVRGSGLKVVPSEQTLHLSAQLKDPATLDAAAWAKLQADSGARWILVPEASHDASGWHLRFNLREGGQSRSIEARGATPLAAAATATDTWLRRVGRRSADSAPSPLTERVQQIDAELFAGQIATARHLIETTPSTERDDPRLRQREGQLEFRAGRIDEAARIFDAILARQPPVDDAIRAQVLMGQGAVEVRRNHWPQAEARYTQALALLERRDAGSGNPAQLGNAYNGRGVAQVQQGKMEAAVRDMGLARIAMQRSGDFVEAATVASNLGKIETMRGHYPQALQEYDHAIAVFERYDVRDYLAATLMSKAETQLLLVQPNDALVSIERAHALAKSLEDAYLVSAIATTRARTMLSLGRLREAGEIIATLQPDAENALAVQELQLRLHMAQGDRAGAVALARRMPAGDANIEGGLALAAVQAALRNRDVATARAWIARAPTTPTPGTSRTPWDLARALLAQGEGNAEAALQAARAASANTEHTGAPEERVQVGLLQARLLLAQGHADAAAALLGDLDAFATTDYRVAWTTQSLYRALGDAGMVATAAKRVQALRGERDPAVEPAL
ncbi:winged helix-turn-helix domain-containing protein [Lysobacter sp. KIS68-7]|uniref:winged helix-turn-helix domain-containing protein n=1 Tax=Lysobacter sp. KIS68-7 TaxID=2904252 RepID=UPI001E3ACA12|nr:winged helix-turn-helix domain-containing protein [Lysobacter sp. KIS68-7]UHQ18685.1 winged helix-turn-helix domain-containing protein [Lysobacter sp. KIS68-7]